MLSQATLFAEVIILRHIGPASEEGLAFHYEVPDVLRDRIAPGHLVVVPLRDQRVPGVVVALSDASPVERTRPIESLLDPSPVLSPLQLDLARWIAEATLAPLNECIHLFVPPGIAGRVDTLYALAVDALPERMNATQSEVFALLNRRGPLRGAQVALALHRKPWQDAVRSLTRRGVVARQPVLLPPSVRPKTARFARLVVDPAGIETKMLSDRAEVAARRASVLHLLADKSGPVLLSDIYAATDCSLSDLQILAEREFIALSEAEVWRDPLAGKEFVPSEAPSLTDDQRAVWEQIEEVISSDDFSRQGATEVATTEGVISSDDSLVPEAERSGISRQEATEVATTFTAFLLRGVTGSGKTEIYMRAVDAMLQRGRQAIVLVPEIALTPQTVRRFAARFPGRVGVLHSGLGEGERYDVWRRARAGAIDILIGPRSAIFAPMARLGLIAIDEEHDGSYKQDHRPYYHAREVALELARRTGALVILGSATPSLESAARARRGEFRALALPRRVLGHAQRIRDHEQRFQIASRYEAASGEAFYRELPPVEIVDLRAELKAGNTHMFSRRLQAALKETLDNGEQAILFLNRRGRATFVSCRDCGHVLKCPRCDTPLTYHESASQRVGESANQLVCHTCNYRQVQPEQCPNCDSRRIRYFGVGTQAVEAAVRELFPDARVLRWDRDTTASRDKTAHEAFLQRFIDRQADVLVGTQMIAKGLDLPLVTLVGVVTADTALNLPDFRSGERTFQLLAQVAGRAGRGLHAGRAIVQTYNPDHYPIVAASRHDYDAFAAQELAFRAEHAYPPATRLARLIVRDPDASKARRAAETMAASLDAFLARRGSERESIIGPAPCFFSRIAGQSRWHIVVRADDPASLLRDFTLLPHWRIDIDPLNML
ncbi:MAG TPA: primosomal protein N' [Anaerolineae bacterium]|nr:primosomal protein N' [Anaerolineae bacterium]